MTIFSKNVEGGAMKQVGDNAKSDLNLGDKFKSVTETNGFLTKYCVTDEFKSCPKQIRNHFLHHTKSEEFPWWKMEKMRLNTKHISFTNILYPGSGSLPTHATSLKLCERVFVKSKSFAVHEK